MKLFVDDLRQCPTGWELARTNTEAIRILATGMVDLVSLDHDIYITYTPEDMIWAGSLSEETFKPVAYYISLMQKKPEVVFHTANFTGGRMMADIIGVKFDHWFVVEDEERRLEHE